MEENPESLDKIKVEALECILGKKFNVLDDGFVRVVDYMGSDESIVQAVDADTVKGGVTISRININDGTVEGLRSDEHKIFSIQYHAEASPGPMDSINLFEEFVKMMLAK